MYLVSMFIIGFFSFPIVFITGNTIYVEVRKRLDRRK
jgi:hypothetical protein